MEIYHHGVKGMKWGVRRFQNKDGSLTPAGKKRISKKYKKAADEVTKELIRTYQPRHIDAYNKAADYMNKGGIDKFNAEQRKKYGKNYADRDGYMEDYSELFDSVFADNWNKSMNDFYSNNANYKKCKELVDKYGMTEWDELARNNEEAVESVRQAVEESLRRS